MGSSREYSEGLRFILSFMLIFLGFVGWAGGFLLVAFGGDLTNEGETIQHILGHTLTAIGILLAPIGFLTTVYGAAKLKDIFPETATSKSELKDRKEENP